ncbi:3-deoxy-D-manno-octulosonic acid kinase [Salinimonas lutimaris]|uniref:3-deoxy-D-manno-octulosonic acid kinase n=1 Tax=Salinimonas lutimaris TaxID=914153 RepID=UPI0010C048FB|nr:3-deoxy-D-manno-octulosonic acid kinase [Salinimonas lutimaris]
MAIKQQKIATGHFTLVNTHFFDSVDKQMFLSEYWQQKHAITGQAKGRGTTFFIQPDAAQQWVLRHYRRGGLPGKLFSDQFLYTGLSRTRPFMELNLLYTMREAGLLVPEPIAAQVVRHGLIYRADLLSVRIPDAQDMHHVLSRGPVGEAVWQAVGRQIRQMHDLNVYHHDLNIRNIMLDAQPQVWIIDFDRCYQRADGHWKPQNLARLYRSLVKESGRSPAFFWTEQDWAALKAGYHQD